jgi:NTE family protein
MSPEHHIPDHPRGLALVLGGGGAAGNAWLIGVVAGLAQAGVDLPGGADLLVGTSAGATAAAMIGSGVPIGDLYRSTQTAPPGSSRPAGGRPAPRPAALPMEAVFDRLRAVGAAASSVEELQRGMGAFALESDPLLGSSEPWRAVAASRLPSTDWPATPTMITTIDARTGELTVFDQTSGVELADAVAASTCLPGLLPTQRVGDGNYIDGGVRSSENADLAAGYATVVVLAPLHGRSRHIPGQFEGIRRFPGHDLAGEVAMLRSGGSRVEALWPDDASQTAMGANVADPSNRTASARAGFEQGQRAAQRLWR